MNKTKAFNLWELIKILVALVLVAIIISQVKLDDLVKLFKNASLPWLASCFVVYFLMTMAKALQYHVLIDGRIPYWRMLYIMVINVTISNFIATSAGIASYLAMLKVEDGIKMSRTASVFIVTKITDVFFIGLFLGISGVKLWNTIQDLRWITLVLLMGIGLLIFSFLATVLFRRSFVRLVESLLSALHLSSIPFVQRGLEALKSLAEQEQSVVFRTVFRSFYLSLLYFAVVMVISILTYKIFIVQFDIWVILFISCLLQLLSLVPISVFGGLGVNDISLAYLYDFFGLSSNEVPALVIGIRVLSYLVGISMLWYLPVFTAYARHKSRTARLQ